jgi:hypothetical protein
MDIPVLYHTLDKVRYFRNLLWGEEYQVRIILGKETVLPLLQMALDDVKGRANQLILNWAYQCHPVLAIKGPTNTAPPILVYIRDSHDNFVKALLSEYSDCEIVEFGKDPTLGHE